MKERIKTKKKSGKVDEPKTRVVIVPRYKARGQYKIVDTSSYITEGSSEDNRTEDQVLDKNKRARLLDLTRNLVRNSSLFNTILGQMTTNVVSTVGGKVVLSLPNESANKSLKSAFKSYTRNVDFFTCDTFNHLLKRVLREYVIGGDVVLIFDDGLVEDSGKVLVFESNEIVNVSENVIEEKYGKGSWCSNGKVYSPNGRHIGTVVSKSQKGCGDNVDPSKCFFLKKDPNGNAMDNNWFHFSSNWREGRGVSQAASAIATIHQLEDLVQSELLASRRNAQIFCWLTQKPEDQEEIVPSNFEIPGGADSVSNMSDDEIAQIVKSEIEEEDVRTIQFNRAKENSIVYEALPEGFDAKQLQMNHPNNNIQVMVDWLANRCASSMGLSKVFATGNPEDGNWRSNQLFSYPAVLEFQKDLEQICDWLFNRFVVWATRKGIIKTYLSEDYMDYVGWQWKGIDSLDPVANENAIELQLKNMTKTYKDILGTDWKEKLQQSAYERKWMIENGITPPQDLMKSGGQTEASKSNELTNEEIDNG